MCTCIYIPVYFYLIPFIFTYFCVNFPGSMHVLTFVTLRVLYLQIYVYSHACLYLYLYFYIYIYIYLLLYHI